MRDHNLATEKLNTYQKHIQMLQEDNSRLKESLKIRQNQQNSTVQKQLQAKNDLINHLTQKLKESTRVIAKVKSRHQQVREELDDCSTLDSEV